MTTCPLCLTLVHDGDVDVVRSPHAERNGLPPDTHAGCAADYAMDQMEARDLEAEPVPEREPMQGPGDDWLEQEPRG